MASSDIAVILKSLLRRPHIVASALLIVGFAACSGSDSSSQQTKEVVDVPPLLEVSTDNDQQAVARPPELSGQLPSDFPGDLPVYVPSSLIDFGQDGGSWLELLTADSQSRVKAELPSMIRGAGWNVEVSGSRVVASRGGRQVSFMVSPGNPGTVVRISY